MTFARALLLLALFAVPAMAQNAAPNCKLQLRTALDINLRDDGRFTIPVTINGASETLLVDTGALVSILSERVVETLNLPTRKAPFGITLMNFGGGITDRIAEVKDLGLGPLRGNGFRFFVFNTGAGADGLFGHDFLGGFDVDFDFARAKLNLISPDHCPGEVVYWTKQPYGVIPFDIVDGHIFVKVQLDGQWVSAILDTGAVDTVISEQKAGKIYALSDEERKSGKRAFKTLAMGDLQVVNPAVLLIPDEHNRMLGASRGNLHMIIGMTVLRRLHLYISYKEKKIYLTPATQY